MHTSSAIPEEVFLVQACTSVGSNGTVTGDHKTRTMLINPRILQKETRMVKLMNKYLAPNTKLTETRTATKRFQ